MLDTVNFKVKNTEVSGIDFLYKIPQYLDTVTGEHNFNGEAVITGTHGNFNVSVNRGGVNIKGGSLCKYYLGDNFKTLGRSEIKRAIEKMSDTLHLPIEKATVTGFDIAQNFIVKHPPQVYYNHLGELKHSTRQGIGNGNGEIETLYYYQSKGVSLFYDKVREQKTKGQPIPAPYQSRNVLRYEHRYKNRLPKTFNVECVTAAMLFSEPFYITCLDFWKDNYFNIKKINDITLNFETMKGKKDLYNMGVLALVEMVGGEINLINQIKEAQKSGNLDKKQAHDLREAITAACKIKEGITTPNDAILELDKKVVEAVKFYR